MNWFIKLSGIILALSLIFIIGVFFNFFYFAGHPSDQELIVNFNNNKPVFEKLIKMMRNDKGLVRVDEDWTRPKDPATIGVSLKRIQVYRDLFKEVNTPRGFYSFYNATKVNLIASSYGLAVSGSGKGYAYRVAKPELTKDSLDDYKSPDGRSFEVYKHISGDWYLYYKFED